MKLFEKRDGSPIIETIICALEKIRAIKSIMATSDCMQFGLSHYRLITTAEKKAALDESPYLPFVCHMYRNLEPEIISDSTVVSGKELFSKMLQMERLLEKALMRPELVEEALEILYELPYAVWELDSEDGAECFSFY